MTLHKLHVSSEASRTMIEPEMKDSTGSKMSGTISPLHESVRHRLHPEYVEFYNRHLISLPPAHLQPISVSRAGSPIMAGGSNPLPVGQVQDYSIRRQSTPGPDVLVRAFMPDGQPPSSAGWPAVLYFHGGGFVFGNINTENTVCTHMCMRARCVVITADYRLAPENPFPAGVDDCWETLLWLTSEGVRMLGLDLRKVAIGGASSGANLAAVVTQRASTRQVPGFNGFVHQLLVVPVADNTATTENNPSWREYQFTASLTAEKMTWYRKHYLPNKDDWPNPEASPLLFPVEQMSRLPPALVLVAELDIMRYEGEQYARKLKEAGVFVECQVVAGMPHPFLAMDAALTAGRSAITLLCDTLAKAFAFREDGSSGGCVEEVIR